MKAIHNVLATVLYCAMDCCSSNKDTKMKAIHNLQEGISRVDIIVAHQTKILK